MHPIHRMRVSILTALLTASLAIPAAMAEDAPPPARCVSVTGTHVTRVVPDVAVWRLSVSDEGKELTEAKASNDIKLEAVMAAVGELGVAAEDVMMVVVTGSGQKGYWRNSQRVGWGRISHTYSFNHGWCQRSRSWQRTTSVAPTPICFWVRYHRL